MSSKLKWQEVPEGDLLKPGTSLEFKTGDWRTDKPIWFKERCIQCYLCWIYCPDAALIMENGKVTGINYDYCKGCGICAWVCPKKAHAIEMESKQK